MKIIFRALLLVVATLFPSGVFADYSPRNGDIIFHTSRSPQSLAIQKATNSPYSHMGIVFIQDGIPKVYEAVEPVKFTLFDAWVRRGDGGRFVVKRLIDADRLLTPKVIERNLMSQPVYEN